MRFSDIARNLLTFTASIFRHPLPAYRGPSKREREDYIYKGQLYWQAQVSADMAEFDGPFISLSVVKSQPLRFVCELEVGGEDRDVTFRFKLPGLPKVAVAVGNVAGPLGLRTVAYDWAKRTAEKQKTYAHTLDPFEGRVTGVSFFEDMLTFSLWSNVNEFSTRAIKTWPWLDTGWRKSFFVWDLLFGEWERESRIVARTTSAVVMPEGDYACTVELRNVSRRRAYGWRAESWTEATVTFPEDQPLPIPGKGENDYDCGQDAIYSHTQSASSVSEAIEQARQSALETRRRYGGPNWRPETEDEPTVLANGESGLQPA